MLGVKKALSLIRLSDNKDNEYSSLDWNFGINVLKDQLSWPNELSVRIGLNTMTLVIGPLAKRLRLEIGLKQTEVAKQIGTSSSNLCRFEQGQRSINSLLLDKLMTTLNTSLEELTVISASEHQSLGIALLNADLSDRQLTGLKKLMNIMSLNESSH